MAAGRPQQQLSRIVTLFAMERRTRSGGKDSITHYPGGHDDLANAVAGACVMADRRESGGAFGVPNIGLSEIFSAHDGNEVIDGGDGGTIDIER